MYNVSARDASVGSEKYDPHSQNEQCNLNDLHLIQSLVFVHLVLEIQAKWKDEYLVYDFYIF